MQINHAPRQLPQFLVLAQERQVRLELIACVPEPFGGDVTRNDKGKVLVEPLYCRVEGIGKCVLEETDWEQCERCVGETRGVYNSPSEILVLHPTRHVRYDLLDRRAIESATLNARSHVGKLQRSCSSFISSCTNENSEDAGIPSEGVSP